MMQESNRQESEKNWEMATSSLASKIARRHISLVECVTDHARSPVRASSIGRAHKTPTLVQQLSERTGWSNTLADRVSRLSYGISRSRQANDFLVKPSTMVWFNRERAIRLQFEADTAMPRAEFQDIPPAFDEPDASLAGTPHQERIERFCGQSSTTYKSQGTPETGAATPIRRAIPDSRQSYRPKASQFATADRVKIQYLPAIAASKRFLQSKGILYGERPNREESVLVPSSEFRPRQGTIIPNASSHIPGFRSHQSAFGGELARSPDAITERCEGETDPDLASEGDSPILERHRETEAPWSSSTETRSKVTLTGSVGRHEPAHERTISLTAKGPPIVLSAVSMGLFSKKSMSPGISAMASPGVSSFLPRIFTPRRLPAIDDEQGEIADAQALVLQGDVISSTSYGERLSRRRPQPSSPLVLRQAISGPASEGLAEAVTAKYRSETAADSPPTAGPPSLTPPAVARLRGSDVRGHQAESPFEGLVSESTAVSPISEPLSLIQHCALTQSPENSVSRRPRRPMGPGLAEEVAERYRPEESMTPSVASKPLFMVQPFITAKSHQVATSSRMDFGGRRSSAYTWQTYRMPSREIADETAIPSSTAILSSFNASTVQRAAHGAEISHEDAIDWSLPTFLPPYTATPDRLFRAHEPIEPVLATIGDGPDKESAVHDIAMAPIQRAETPEYTSGVLQSELEESPAGQDLETLAREVYTIIKRRLGVERERVGCR